MYSITNTSSAAQNSSLEPRREILLNTLISKIGQINSGSPSADVKHIAGFCWNNMISPNPNHPKKIGDIVADSRVTTALKAKGFDSLGTLIDLREQSDDEIKSHYPKTFKESLPKAPVKNMQSLFKDEPLYSYRGDAQLWKLLTNKLAHHAMPETKAELREVLENAYQEITGRSTAETGTFSCKATLQSFGLSNGMVGSNWGSNFDRMVTQSGLES